MFYLRKDAHPESNRMILQVFFLGMLATIPALGLEYGFSFIFQGITNKFLATILTVFIGIALVEELLKYSVVKFRILGNKAFDEPLDAMLYLIIAALGFAAVENLIILHSLINSSLASSLFLTFLRFIGATFLHTLASGILGYFLALSIYKKSQRIKLLFSGIIFATLFHGLYNFYIMNLESNFNLVFIFLLVLLSFMGITVFLLFNDLKKMLSICR